MRYVISNRQSGVYLWMGEASSKRDALEAYAREVGGYATYAEFRSYMAEIEGTDPEAIESELLIVDEMDPDFVGQWAEAERQ